VSIQLNTIDKLEDAPARHAKNQLTKQQVTNLASSTEMNMYSSGNRRALVTSVGSVSWTKQGV